MAFEKYFAYTLIQKDATGKRDETMSLCENKLESHYRLQRLSCSDSRVLQENMLTL